MTSVSHGSEAGRIWFEWKAGPSLISFRAKAAGIGTKASALAINPFSK